MRKFHLATVSIIERLLALTLRKYCIFSTIRGMKHKRLINEIRSNCGRYVY